MHSPQHSDKRGWHKKIPPSVRIKEWLDQGVTFIIRNGELEATFPEEYTGLDKRYVRRLLRESPLAYVQALTSLNSPKKLVVGETFGVSATMAKKMRKDLILDVFGEFTRDKAREIRDKIVELGMNNDIQALKLACQYISESASTQLEEPLQTSTIAEVLTSQDIVLKNVAKGDIKASFGLEIMKMLDMKREAIKTEHLETRLQWVETSLKNQGSGESSGSSSF